jgi:hypothetical protein
VTLSTEAHTCSGFCTFAGPIRREARLGDATCIFSFCFTWTRSTYQFKLFPHVLVIVDLAFVGQRAAFPRSTFWRCLMKLSSRCWCPNYVPSFCFAAPAFCAPCAASVGVATISIDLGNEWMKIGLVKVSLCSLSHKPFQNRSKPSLREVQTASAWKLAPHTFDSLPTLFSFFLS